MATWSTVLPKCHYSIGYSGSIVHNTLRTPFEAGYVQTRARFTQDRRRFRCGWNGLTQAQFNAFMTFVEDTKGSAEFFSWDDESQSTAVTYSVRFQADSIQWEYIAPGTFKVGCSLTGIPLPLSSTEIWPSLCKVTRIRVQKPAIASSTLLSITS